MKAVIETGGKQYYVTEGTVLYIEKLEAEAGETVKFDKVLMANGTAGMPVVDGAYVEALRDLRLKWRGSSNQRVIDVKASIKNNNITLYE